MNDLAQLAQDRYEIADALHRYAFGLDHDHADSVASVLAEDCKFDFTPAGRKLGLSFPLVIGRQEIVSKVLPLIGPLRTSHTASNIQIEISGDEATLAAYVMAQHLMPHGDPQRDFALLMNRYDCELVRATNSSAGEGADRRSWRFKRITIDNAWAQGNPEILHVSATSNALRSKRIKPSG